ETTLVPFATLAAASISSASAEITLQAGASLRATGKVSLQANAETHSTITTSGRFLGVTFGSSEPTAEIDVQNGADISAGVDFEAGGDFEALATTGNTLDILTIVPQGGDLTNVSFSYGRARSTSEANIEAGASVQATNATIQAVNSTDFRNRAIAAGFASSTIAGVGATLVLGTYQSDAKAVVAGIVTTTQNLTVDARSLNTRDETRAFGAVSGPAGQSTLLDAVRSFLGGVSL